MNTATRLSAFALGLAAVFGTAYGAGHVIGPVSATDPVPAAHSGHGDANGTTGGHGDGTGAPVPGDSGAGPGSGGRLPGGLLVSDRGYTLAAVPGDGGEFAFRITGPDGRPVTAYDVEHDQRMHLIVVRRDLSGFRHVHPELDASGTWRVASPLGAPGSWRAFADFKPTGAEPLTLGVDVGVPGPFTPIPLPAPAPTAHVDGYTVTLEGTLRPGQTSRLTLNIARDGTGVADLQPYLGAYGHLVALREGDLAYLHVHPDGEPGDPKTRPGPQVTFYAEVPSAGRYRLYLDFRHGGTVHTAEFTVAAGADAPVASPAATGAHHPAPGGSESGHAHNGQEQ